jgi:hypothetical protein
MLINSDKLCSRIIALMLLTVLLALSLMLEG